MARKKAKPKKRSAVKEVEEVDEPSDSSGVSIPEVIVDAGEDEAQPAEDPEGLILDVGRSVPSTRPSKASAVPALRKRTAGDTLGRFLSEMGKFPVLSNEEERDLTLRYHEDGDPIAARKLVVHNLRLVVRMAYKYRRAWANVLDLIQEGNIGLVEAVGRYDPFKGAKFSTYATFWIRAYMLRYLLEHSRMVKVARTRVGRKLFFQLNKEREKLRALGIDPKPKLLAERLGVAEDDLVEVAKHMDQSEVRLDAPLRSEEGDAGTILDTMSIDQSSPEAQAFKSEFVEDVSRALASFAEELTDEREIAAWHKHMLSEDPMSLSQLGKEFGVTKQRMGQIVSGIRKRLKAHLLEKVGPDVELGFAFDES